MQSLFQDKYIIAESAWRAKKLLYRIKQGKAPIELLFPSEKEATKRFCRLSQDFRRKNFIFKVQFK